MAADNNETLVRSYFRDFNALEGDASRFSDAISKRYFAPEFIAHYSSGDMNVEQYSRYGMAIATAFPDLQQSIEDIFAQGDRVAVRVMLRGTHKGPFSGVPATGRQVNVRAAIIFRMSQNAITEVWAFPDELGLLRQLGILPNQVSRG